MKRVTFVFAGPAERVSLQGETSDFRNGIPMDRREDGAFYTEMDLPPGAYAYKLLVDDHWVLDPANPRTVQPAEHVNSVRVVDGTGEPFLFAPAPPFVETLVDGSVRLMVGVRRGSEATPGLQVEEGEGLRDVPLAPAFQDGTHAWFVGELGAASDRVAFHVSGSGPFVHQRRRDRTPSWLRSAVIYAVFVDRFRPAEPQNGWEIAGRTTARWGGHLRGVERSLDELAEAGVTCLYLTPVHPAASAHRYDFEDPLAVDPLLGGEAAYRALVDAAHARGMRVLQDLALSHASPTYPPAADVLKNGARSAHAGLFQWSASGALLHYGTRTDAPLLDLRSEAARGLAFAVVDAFLARGVDGFRVDMAAEVPLPLLVALRERVQRVRPDAAMVGELVPNHPWRWLEAEALDAATDFGAFEILRRALVRGSLKGVAGALAEGDLRRGGDARTSAVRFVSTHDHVRLATLLSREGALHRLPLAYLMLFTLPGIPMLLYGEEVGLFSSAADEEPEDAWPDRMPMVFEGVLRDEDLRRVVRTLAHLRRRSRALTEGTLELVHDEGELLVFRRAAAGEVVDVVISLADGPRTVDLEDDALPYVRTELLVGGATAEGASVTLLPQSAAVLGRSAREPDADIAPRARRNLAVLVEDFQQAREAPLARPVRFDFAVTERCNLACLHCITHAPTRTREGTARTLTPRIVDALRDDLAYARYAGFVHGGESLTAPIFWDLLEALRRARGREPYVAHLLSNGLLLSESTATRLVEAGVNSLSVSLDGATEAVNDAIRVGGKFVRITQQVAAVTKLRRAHQWDLRLGLSYVALDSNVHELTAFVELAATLGVDWVKLEEGAPANAYAARSLLRPDDARLRNAVATAQSRGEALGLVVVDHTGERPRYRCRVTEAEARDLQADELANRSDINACRSPWETVAIEASGDVRLGDFWGPLLGNLLHAPLTTLFTGDAARQWRQKSREERVCNGDVTCIGQEPAP